jgi:hypothetical protein
LSRCGALIVGFPRCLLRENEFTGFNKGGELGKEQQQRLENTELVVETTDKLVHQGPLQDRGIAIGEWVGELVKLMTEVIGRHLALNEIGKFTLQVNNMVGFVSYKLVRKMHPNLAWSGML